jgi:hypothetical protein
MTWRLLTVFVEGPGIHDEKFLQKGITRTSD